ncbi:hypothetical protein CJ263_06565 [Maribacter cobaltidurans]|uniref:Uncharacterized protein n=1 Tax=Maribacter cobaltidurans TaxID=1178778 RepID=A0A223V454_9FLAO|nr:hypothetical protein CJ263_06565 [Maribacter cobaltidurans]
MDVVQIAKINDFGTIRRYPGLVFIGLFHILELLLNLIVVSILFNQHGSVRLKFRFYLRWAIMLSLSKRPQYIIAIFDNQYVWT